MRVRAIKVGIEGFSGAKPAFPTDNFQNLCHAKFSTRDRISRKKVWVLNLDFNLGFQSWISFSIFHFPF